jgi:DNA-binding winged helix-turn-helix (wHTH) protein
MPANSSSRIIRFSTFEVNLDTGELRQRGQKVKLQEQPFQVLAALLERPGELVTRGNYALNSGPLIRLSTSIIA